MKLIPTYSSLFLLLGITGYILLGCSLSYQNICSHGTATDLVDETQDTSPDLKTDLTANVSGIPAI